MNKTKSRLFFALTLAVLLLLGFSRPALAEEEETPVSEDEPVGEIDAPTTAALKVSPVSMRMALDPGQTVEKKFTVENTGADSFTYRVYATPYSHKGSNYDPDFETESTYTKLSQWITFLDEEDKETNELTYSLEPGKSHTIRYRVKVPDDVPGGGQYASLFAETLTDEPEDSGIMTISRAGIILFASISGDTRREVKISNATLNSNMFGSRIYVSADVENMGNIDLQASTNIAVYSVFGKELYNDTLISTVLPETIRTIYHEWNETPLFGVFHLRYHIQALGTEVESSRYILVMPPIIMATTIVLFSGIVIVLIIYLRRKKEYSTRIQNSGTQA